MIGTKLAHYEITAHLGSGGMGDVYQATDSKLGRSVAIKFLPEAFSHDTERVARFQREARVLASLSHPNIAAIYGVEEIDSRHFLVMELVAGETLEERIKRGAISIEVALPIARQIAEALEAAHEHGIIHRDLKPANIKVRDDGTVKVLDFGLAKVTEPTGFSSSGASQSPTITSPAMTQQGVILGTPAYMSPEQTKGRTADKRSDVWAFGAVLYEMLTGRRAFEGEDVSETLAAILKGNPDWNLLPAALPSTIRKLIERCLSKDRQQRISDVAVVQFLLNEPAPGPSHAERRHPTALLAVCLVVALIAISTTARLLMRPQLPPPAAVTRFSVVPPPGVSLSLNLGGSIALSPDGSRLVYTARMNDSMIYSRSTDQLDAVPIRGTEGGSAPFFSPDGQWIGFLSSDHKLKKVPAGGGAPLTLCDVNNVFGATWLPDDSVIFRPGTNAGLWRVSAAGGTPQEFLKPDSNSEVAFRWPEVLPGGKAIIFAIQGSATNVAIGALRLDTRERVLLVEGATYAHYFPSGHLVFSRAGQILAVPFDVRTLQAKGTPVPVIESVNTGPQGLAQFASSTAGSIAYIPGGETQESRTLVWVDRRGSAQLVSAPKRNYEFARLSPDGQQIAVGINGDIWLYRFTRGTLSRLTFKGNVETPVWTPDGKHVAYIGGGSNPAREIMWKVADGSATEEVLAGSDQHLHLGAWSPKGDALVATASDSGTLWLLQMNGKRTLQPLPQTPYPMRGASISPDGRWLAYASNDTNRSEVYVQPFPNLGAKYQISTDGGAEPIWAKDGRELFYRNGDKMMAVPLDAKGERLEAANPTLLFEGRYAVAAVSGGDAWYDVSLDGKRFLMVKHEDQPNSAASIVVVQNWATELKRLAPAK